MTAELAKACERAIHVVRPDGTVLRAGRAALHLLAAAGWERTAAALRRPPLVWGVEAMYAAVAEHRSAFARWFFTEEDPEAERWVVEGR